jgi:hypothetical protein
MSLPACSLNPVNSQAYPVVLRNNPIPISLLVSVWPLDSSIAIRDEIRGEIKVDFYKDELRID